ncbi:MAG: precorrin-6y C5,15-methyltransferase (decarboxylating) subunit CbiE [Sterolibacterium sp.]|jgi:precorrin-6Y C5,15-methyltransferase (decarboxylating)|nr:precorrin-6y C5,15-methyltransferase (decarboxylating) subunit CbiE [Sterolibacterium sp.]
MKPTESTPPCTLLGMLDDGWGGLSATAHQRLLAADLLIGAQRTLELIRPHLSAHTTLRPMDGQLGSVPGWITAALDQNQRVVALATGDPLCHGIASWLVGKLGAARFEILPAVSTLQLACARFKLAWQDICIATCHSADAGEWFPGAPPTHGLYPLMRCIARQARVMLFTGPENTPARLARALMMAGYGDDTRLSVACRLLLPDETLYPQLTPAAAALINFPQPNVVIVERNHFATPQTTSAFGLNDDEYAQRAPGKGLITKQEARALSLAKMRLLPDAIVWDIGAGSGAVGLEAARLAPAGHVWAIEKNTADIANARLNAQRFRVGNYTLVEGKAPQYLDTWPAPDAVFIGGSGGELAGLIGLVLERLKPGGRLVMNFVTLENLATATTTLKEADVHWDVVQLQASRSQPILDMQRMAAQNPVCIITARKESP